MIILWLLHVWIVFIWGILIKIVVYQFSVKFVYFYYILMEKSAETAMVFYKFAPSAAAATPLNQKQYKIGVAYIVRNQNTNFQ